MVLYARYYGDERKIQIVNAIGDACFQAVAEQFVQRGPGPVNLERALESVRTKWGAEATPIVDAFLELLPDFFLGSVLSGFRSTEWTNLEQLETLFEHENIAPVHGRFLDQRFINYLERNFASIDEIHWRNFERLTAEFFEREGYRVELGAGQGDDGIDVRVWQDDAAAPTILVQCKRQKAKVGKAIVKALWTDVVHEGARSGLIVTTSALQPGAQKTCLTRQYRVTEADRTMLRQWLERLRRPGSGTLFAG
jgi:restriction system protein